MATAQDVNQLLERIFLKFGSADSDDQFEAAVKKFLPPVLLQLKSSEEGIRKKVLEMLVHVNKRLKSRPNIQLPMEALIDIYADKSCVDGGGASFIQNFTIIYLKMGFERLNESSKASLVPKLIRSLEDKPESHRESFLFLLLPVLGSIPCPESQSTEERNATLGLDSLPTTTKALLDTMFDVLLLPYGIFTPAGPPSADSSAGPAVPGTGGGLPPGMSKTAFKRVTGDNPLGPEALEKTKLSVLKFIGMEFFKEEEVVVHYVIGSSDTRHSVATVADLALKRAANAANWNHAPTVAKIYDLFRGSGVAKAKSAPAVAEEDKRSPASTRLRLKLFPFLLKSRQSSEHFPALVQVVFDCLFGGGANNAKLKANAIQLTHHAADYCADAKFKLMGATLLPAMTKVLKEMETDDHLCSLALVAIGKIGHRLPHLVQADLSLIQSSFDSLATAKGERLSSLQNMLSLLAPSFVNLEASKRSLLEAIIMQNAERAESPSRLMALKFATLIFPRDHMASRFVVLVCAGDPREEVRGEALKALRSRGGGGSGVAVASEVDQKAKVAKLEGSASASNEAGSRTFPPFRVAVDYLYEKGKFAERKNKQRIDPRLFSPEMFRQVVFFLRDCLAFDAGCALDEEEESARRGADELDNDSMRSQAPAIVKRVRQLLKEDRSAKSPVKKYFEMVESLVRQDGGAECLYVLSELVAADDAADLGREVAENLDWIRDKFLFSARDQVRESAAQLMAILLAVDNAKVFSSQVETLLTAVSTANTNYEKMSGGLLALGAIVGRRFMTAESKGGMLMEDLEIPSFENAELVSKALQLITTNLNHSIVLVQTSALASLVEMSRFLSLPLLVGEFPECKADDDQKPTEKTAEEPFTKASLATALLDLVSSAKHPAKVREKAAMASAALCCGVGRCDGSEGSSSTPFPHAEKVLEGLLEASKIKELELHFHVGAALSTAALGPGSRLARDPWTVDFDALDRDAREATVSKENLEMLVDKLTGKYLSHENKHVKQAAAVWTLALVQEAGGMKLVQGKMAKLQDKLLRLLFDEDEITQELSAKSLCLCYSFSTEESRKDLVSNLCDTLVGGGNTRDASETTESSPANGAASPNSSSSATAASSNSAVKSTAFFNVGTKASAYRELAAIAIELNQPDLVYKFIFLAHKNSSLKTPGVASSLTSKRRHAEIAAEASVQLLPHKQTILPKLYRYLHDPDVKIQTAMTAVWRCIVPSDANAVVDEYLKGILDELMREINNRGSVVREACCHALTEALRGRALNPTVVERLGDLWRVVLARMDDVKETVRKAAIPMARMMSHASILACDTNNGKLGATAIDATLPVLLKEGFMSTNVAEIRALVLDTLQKLTKQTGSLLKPHLSLLMPALLESISGLESSSMNYLSLHLAGSNRADVQEKLDEARLSASKSSPMMETLKFCIQYVDDDVMQQLAPAIIDVLKSGVGMSTKASAAELLIAFIFQIPQVVAPFAAKFMTPLLNGLSDRQSGVRRSYSTAVGYVSKVASAKSMEKSIRKLQSWYVEKPPEEQTLRRAIAWTFNAVSKHALDQLKAQASTAMPLAFFASHAQPEEGEEAAQSEAAIWSEVWTEVTPGMEQGIHLYLKEIVELLQTALTSPSWPLKSQAARAVGTIAEKLPSDKMDAENLKNLLNAVAVEGLAGRTWEGKEALLDATRQLCCRNASHFLSSTMEVDLGESERILRSMRDPLLSILTREAKKNKLSYKISAIDAAARVFESWKADDQFVALSTTILERLVRGEEDEENCVNGGNSMDHDGGGQHPPKAKSPDRVRFEETALESLGRAFPDRNPSTTDEPALRKTKETIDVLAERMGPAHVWKIQLAALKGVQSVVERSWVLSDASVAEGFAKVVVGPICHNLGNKKYVAIRKCALDALGEIVKSDSRGDKCREALKDARQPLTDMRTDVNVELQKKSGELLNLLSR